SSKPYSTPPWEHFNVDQRTMAATFSYAQAAKGIATPPSMNKPVPSPITQSKEASSISASDSHASL
ncbi:hypothetical protein CFE70_004566, partial [Pyrenophora teres f. teres 0-1]